MMDYTDRKKIINDPKTNEPYLVDIIYSLEIQIQIYIFHLMYLFINF